VITATANYLAADAKSSKAPVFVVTIESYSRAFSNRSAIPGYVGTLADWLVSIEDLQTTVNDLDGGTDLADLVFTVQDGPPDAQGRPTGLITASFPSFTFEGKLVQLFAGYDGLDFADFIPLFTARIDSVESSNSNLEYVFSCPDIRSDLNRAIYTTADDGEATGSGHVRTLNGHPLDILIDALEAECGLTSGQVDEAKITQYRDTIYSGAQMSFVLDAAPVAKEFIETELMKPLGAYLRTDNLGRVTVEFAYPVNSTPVFSFTPDNLLDVPAAGQADLINQVIVRLDATTGNSSSGFAAERVEQSDASISKYGMYGQQIIESKGLRSGLNGLFLARMTAFLLFLRYASKALCHGDSGKNVSSDPINAPWNAALLDPGDFVKLTHPLVPDRVAGVLGVVDKPYVVMDRTWQFPIGGSAGTVQLKLLEIDLNTFQQFLIAPNGEASYTSASTTDRAKYMFLCNDIDLYSTGAAGNTLS
jgi:hypothetical protein